MPGGNPLAPDDGMGTWGELRAVTVHHPYGKHFSTFVGKAVSMHACGSSIWRIVLLDPYPSHLSKLPTGKVHNP